MRQLLEAVERHHLADVAASSIERSDGAIQGLAVSYRSEVVAEARRALMLALLERWRRPAAALAPEAYLEIRNLLWRAAFRAATAWRGDDAIELVVYTQPGGTSRVPFDTRLPIRYEVRPRATLYRRGLGSCAAGHRVSALNGAGSVGGLMREASTGRVLAMTAGHVVENPAQSLYIEPPGSELWNWAKNRAGFRSRGVQARVIDVVRNVPVKDRARPTVLASVDSALLAPEICEQDVQAPDVRSAESLMFGEAVQFVGAASGRVIAELGPVVVEFPFTVPFRAERVHFGNVVELRFGESGPRHCPTRPGDSGAWVLTEDGGWYGCVLGGDNLVGYATFAQTTSDHWTARGWKLA